MAWSGLIGNGGARIFGLPFSVGEYNSDYPTPYWGFVGPVQAVAGGFQNWSTLIRCGMNPTPEQFFNPTRVRRIETASSPVMMMSERIVSLLFAQNEIKPLPVKVPMVLTPDYLLSHLDLKAARFSRSNTPASAFVIRSE